MPTLASKWFEEGLEQGRKEGIEQGIEQVRTGAMRTLLGLLEHRFGSLQPLFVERLQPLTVDQLQSLSLYALDARSIDQVAEEARRLRAGE